MGVSSPASKESFADVTSFFKIMIGDEFSEALFLPPKYAKTVSNLAGQKVQLEDANGHRWTVTLSKYKGSLAFEKGWRAFSVEHGLKIGEFLVFNRINHAHFLVTIYGRSGCAKLPLTQNKERKRKIIRASERSSGRNKHFRETDSDNVNGQNSNTSAVSIPNIEVNQTTPMDMDNTSNTDGGNNLKEFSKTNCVEEQFYMINKDIGVGQSELKDSLYDLANFEMRPSSVLDRERAVLENERSCMENFTIPNFESDATKVWKGPVSGEVQGCRATPEVPKLQKQHKSEDVGGKKKSIPVKVNESKNRVTFGPTKCSNINSGKGQFSVSKKRLIPVTMNNQSSKKFAAGLPKFIKPEIYSGKMQFSVSQKQHTPLRMSDQISKQKFAGSLDFSGLPKFVNPDIISCGKNLKVVKEEHVEMKAGKSLKAVKEELLAMEGGYLHGGVPGYQWIMKWDDTCYPQEEVDDHVTDSVKTEPLEIYDSASTVSVKIPVSEAPRKIPYLELQDKLYPKQKRQREVVYLRGPVSNVDMWPVLYFERFGLKFLTSGWEPFREANGIKPGDECAFRVENAKELIFRVTVVHN